MKAIFVLLLLAAAVFAAPPDTVLTEGVVNAPVEEVWKAFTTKEGIESWMVAKTDFRLEIGATWRTSYNKDSNLNDDAAIHQTILAFDPGRMLSYRVIKYPKGFPFPNAITKTWSVVYFEPVSAAQTKVTARMLGFADDDESQKMRAFFEQGNKSTLDNLVKKFEKH